MLGKSEFSCLLGRTEMEALKAYPDVHRHFERITKSIPSTTGAAEIASIKEQISASFLELGLSRSLSKAAWGEQIAREEEAERILAQYPLDEETRHPDRADVSLRDHLVITALRDSPESIQAEFTISDVFSHYLEHWKASQTDQMKIDKYAERIARMQCILLDITGADIPVTELTRQHGRMLRDKLKAQPARSGRGRAAHGTVQRNFNIPKAAINHGIKELDILMTNPLNGIDLGKAPVRAYDLRHPLPKPVIAAMYGELSNNQALLDIWTLIHHTGAQNAEVLGLKTNDLYLTDPIPHFEITPDDERSVKERARIRKVPLIGLALETAQRLAASSRDGDYLFPKYGPTNKHTNFSNTCMTRLRKHTKDSRHSIYSLRHHMKDCMRQADVPLRVQLAIMGHSDGERVSEQYGSAVTLEEMHKAMLSITLI